MTKCYCAIDAMEIELSYNLMILICILSTMILDKILKEHMTDGSFLS